MHQKIRIAIGEQMTLARQALMSLLVQDTRLEIVADSENGPQLLQQLQHQKADVALLDAELPGMDHWHTAIQLRKNDPAIKIIVLNHLPSASLEELARLQGIHCLLSRLCTADVLFEAIHTVHQQGRFSNTKLPLFQRGDKTTATGTLLNEKERQILKKICEGKTNKEIAVFLNVSAATIDFYRTKIYRKTASGNLAQLFRYALRHNLVRL